MESFVYCWTDHKTQKLYVGSHKGNLDDGYVCSSKYMLQEYKVRPHDFTRQIIAVGNAYTIRKFESFILKRSKGLYSPFLLMNAFIINMKMMDFFLMVGKRENLLKNINTTCLFQLLKEKDLLNILKNFMMEGEAQKIVWNTIKLY